MCTLSIAPEGRDALILVSNRDESKERSPATLPQCLRFGERRVLMPLDPDGGGSWIGLSDEGRAACLLNGAWKAHESRPPYAKSRGLLLRESFEWKDPERFAEEVPLEGIGSDALNVEPFTLVLVRTVTEPAITVLRWDEKEREVRSLDPGQPHVLSAPKLYSQRAIEQTEERFEQLLERCGEDPLLEDLKAFNEGERYRSKVKKAGEEAVEGLETLSCTAIRSGTGRVEMGYDDLQEVISGNFQFKF